MVEQFRLLFDAMGVDWILWILLILSATSIAIMIERWMFFRQTRASLDQMMASLDNAFSNENMEEALQELKDSDSMEATVLSEVLRTGPDGLHVIDDIISSTLARERLRFDQRLSFLGTLGNNAPFIGLLGTVLGIISAFGDLETGLSRGDSSKNEMLMGSIAEALVATAIGLLVAIPAVIAYNAFKGAIRRRTNSTEALCHFALAKMRGKTPPPR